MADEVAGESSIQGKEDDELDELLDSALEDFGKTSPSTTKQTSQADSQNGASSLDSTKISEKSSDTTTVKTQGSTSATTSSQDTADHARLEASLGQAPGLDEFENAMKTMLGNEPKLLAQLEQFAQAAACADHDSPSSLADLEANLARTMNHLAQNAKDLENCPTAPLNEDFFKAMSDMNLAGGSDGELDFLPLMQGMMQNLLSKDILYPALNDLKEKYPAWLGENKASLPSEELDRYRKQYELVCDVCSEYDAETSVDSDEVKKNRFEKLLSLMQQMQECGQPPADLVGEMPPGFTAPIPEMPDAPELPDELKNECKVT